MSKKENQKTEMQAKLSLFIDFFPFLHGEAQWGAEFFPEIESSEESHPK